MKHRLLGAALVGALGAATLTAAPAHADQDCVYIYFHDGLGASGCFENKGDHIYTTDLRVDGMRAVTEWHTDYGRKGECHDSNGANNGTVDCNYDMQEDAYITFRVVIRNGSDGVNLYESGWRYEHIFQ